MHSGTPRCKLCIIPFGMFYIAELVVLVPCIAHTLFQCVLLLLTSLHGISSLALLLLQSCEPPEDVFVKLVCYGKGQALSPEGRTLARTRGIGTFRTSCKLRPCCNSRTIHTACHLRTWGTSPSMQRFPNNLARSHGDDL